MSNDSPHALTHVPMDFGCEERDCSPEAFPSHYRPSRPDPAKQLAMVRGLLDAYGEAEGTPSDYEFLVYQLRAATADLP